MRKFLFFYFFLLGTNILFSQNKISIISGYIRDSLSEESLAGVEIRHGKNSTYTNEYGFFSISAPSKTDLILKFDHIGYTPVFKRISLEKDTSLTIRLSLETLELNEIIVLSGRPRLSSVDHRGTATVNTSQLKYIPALLGEQDIFKYLQLQPGVKGGKEASSGLNIRGGSADQTLVLLDDIPIYNQTHGFGFLSVFSGDAVKSVKLYKGYIPPEYGGRLSGVAAINMKEGTRKGHRQSVQIGTTTASATIEGCINKGKGSYLISGRYFIPDLLLRGAYLFSSQKENKRIRFGFYDITAKTSYDLNADNTIYLSLYTGHDALLYRYNTSDYDPVEKITRRTKSSVDLGWGNVAASARLSSKLNGNTFLAATAYYSFMGTRKLTNYEDIAENTDYETATRSNMEEAGVRTGMEHFFSRRYELSYGALLSGQFFRPRILYYLRNGLPDRTNYGKKELYTASIFINNRIKLNRFDINLGIRGSIFNNRHQTARSIEPRFSVSYSTNKSSIWAAYVQNKQALFPMNQYYMAFPVDYWVPFTNNKYLPRSRQVSVGYKKSFGDYLDVCAEGYYKQSRALSLIYDSDDYLLGEGGYDKASGKAYGIEISLQYQRNRLSFLGTYSWSRSQYNINETWIPFMYDTPHELNIFSSYDVLQQTGRIHTFSANINYKTGLPYIFAQDMYPSSENYNAGSRNSIMNNPIYANSRLKSFFRVDFNYNMEKKLRKGSRIWQISLLNATAHKNPYAVYRKPKNFTSGNRYTSLILIPFLPSFSYKRYF